jgi:hypothetical protein
MPTDDMPPPKMEGLRNAVVILRSYSFTLNFGEVGALVTVTGSSGDALHTRFIAIGSIHRLTRAETLQGVE